MACTACFPAQTRTFPVRSLGYSPGAVGEAESAIGRDEVLARVRARVLAALRRWLSPEDAEDLAQETLVLLSTKYAHVAAAEELVKLAVEIAWRKRLAHWRKGARRRGLGETPLPSFEDGTDPVDRTASGERSPEEIARARQRLALLLEAAQRLAGRCREILRRKLEGASFVEIAAELGRPVNTVYSWDHRCHQKLKELLGDRWGFVAGREERS